VPEEIFFYTSWCKGRYQRQTLTIRLGATPFELISDPPLSSSIFMPDALPANLSWLGTGIKYAGPVTQWLGYGILKYIKNLF